MYEITATIGLYVNAEKRTWPKAIVRERIDELFPCASITWGEGVWKGQWEENVTLSVGSEERQGIEDARRNILALGLSLRQEAIYVLGEGVVYLPCFPSQRI